MRMRSEEEEEGGEEEDEGAQTVGSHTHTMFEVLKKYPVVNATVTVTQPFVISGSTNE